MENPFCSLCVFSLCVCLIAVCLEISLYCLYLSLSYLFVCHFFSEGFIVSILFISFIWWFFIVRRPECRFYAFCFIFKYMSQNISNILFHLFHRIWWRINRTKLKHSITINEIEEECFCWFAIVFFRRIRRLKVFKIEYKFLWKEKLNLDRI